MYELALQMHHWDSEKMASIKKELYRRCYEFDPEVVLSVRLILMLRLLNEI